MLVKPYLSDKVDLNLTKDLSEVLGSFAASKVHQFVKEGEAGKADKEVGLYHGDIMEETLDVLVLRTNHDFEAKVL